jgi:hypothetical protein
LIVDLIHLKRAARARIVQKLGAIMQLHVRRPQHASKARSTIDPLCFRILDLDRRDQLVVEALMVSLKVIKAWS